MKSFSFSIVAISLAVSGIAASSLAQMSKASMARQVEVHAFKCEAGDSAACRRLVLVTRGQCAGPEGSGCHYTLEIIK
jgi:hypothetical protein